MAYTYPDGVARLGPSYSGLTTIGYRLVNSAGTVVTAFTTTNVAETGVPGNYRVVTAGAEGLPVPSAFLGRVVWGTSGVDLAEEWIWPAKFEAAFTGSVASVAGDVAGKVLGGGASAISGVGVNANTTQINGAAASGVSGPVAANVTQVGGQTVTAAAPVTFLASVGTATASTAQTGDNYALANGASGFAAIKANTAAVVAKLPTNGIADETLVIAATNTILTAVGTPAQSAQIPANFTTATFASAGVFSVGALANAPTGGSAPTAAQVRQEMDANSTKLAVLPASFPANFPALGVTAGGKIGGVVLTDACTTNTDMRGTDNAATATSLAALAATVGSAGAGLTAVPKTGFKLASDGMDAVVIETGVNARQAQAAILAASAGVLSGAATGTVVVKGGNVATTRITATVDADGDRTAVTLSLPA